MNPHDDELVVDGAWPDIIGQTLEQLITEEYWDHGAIADTANVAWIKVSSQWHRLYFDLGMIFWRRSNDEPCAYTMPELHGEVRLADVGEVARIVGESIQTVEGRT